MFKFLSLELHLLARIDVSNHFTNIPIPEIIGVIEFYLPHSPLSAWSYGILIGFLSNSRKDKLKRCQRKDIGIIKL